MSSVVDFVKDGVDTITGGAEDLVKGVTGETAADAAKKGSAQQVAASERALELLRSDLQPFRDLGVSQIEGVQSLSSDPQAQIDFLQNNPLFQGLSDEATRQTNALAASQGKLAGGGTKAELQNQIMLQGNNLINQQLNRQLPLLNMGQNSAAQQGAGSSQLITGIGNAQAAGTIGAGNAMAGGAGNILGAASGIAGLFMPPVGAASTLMAGMPPPSVGIA